MSRVDFYLLQSQDAHTRRLVTCRLIEKAYKQGHTVFLKTGSEEETRMMDDLLWTFRQGSFLAHEIYVSGEPHAPIMLGYGVIPPEMQDVLVNLDGHVPKDYGRFDRVAELIDQDEDTKEMGRKRYRVYQDAGHAITTHQLDVSA
jgi:DNA polymerase-3 subunit chi